MIVRFESGTDENQNKKVSKKMSNNGKKVGRVPGVLETIDDARKALDKFFGQNRFDQLVRICYKGEIVTVRKEWENGVLSYDTQISEGGPAYIKLNS